MERGSYRYGFTLVELSIVLVIIGLIVGGITAGRELINAAKLRSVISEVNGFKVAISAFELQYAALPGDMPNATDYWSGTANGNDDGKIAIGNEDKRSWQHLTLSGVMPGTYTGSSYVPGTGAPISSILKNSGYHLHNQNWYQMGYKNSLLLGAYSGSCVLSCSLLNTPDARSIDLKMDDGIADSGKVLTRNGSATSGCVTGAWGNPPPSNYIMSNLDIKCAMIFLLE